MPLFTALPTRCVPGNPHSPGPSGLLPPPDRGAAGSLQHMGMMVMIHRLRGRKPVIRVLSWSFSSRPRLRPENAQTSPVFFRALGHARMAQDGRGAPVLLFTARPIGVGRKRRGRGPTVGGFSLVIEALRTAEHSEGLSLAHSPGPNPLEASEPNHR
jgi:hypothetical protein